MKTIKMSKSEAAELYNGLVESKDLKSKTFALKAAKNMNTIKDALQDIEDLGRPSEEFTALSVKVQQIMTEDPENGKAQIEELEIENEDLVTQRKEQMGLVTERLKEDVELELAVFSEETLPDDISAEQINKIIKIIE